MQLAVAFGLLVAVRVPFVREGAIQDDAFITWRCARQLADTGVYGFNPGERLSASTSHAYVAVVALLRLVFGEAYLDAVLAMNTCCTVAALLFLSELIASEDHQLACWVIAALSPIALIVSVSGMETALLLLAACVALRGLAREGATGRRAAFVALALLPSIRLDAVFLGGVISLAHVGRPRLALRAVASLAAGLLAVICFNASYFGVLVNQSIIAKLDGLRASHGAIDVLLRVKGAFVGGADITSVFVPLPTKYLASTGAPFALVVASALGALVWERRRVPDRATSLALAGIVLGPPAIYAAAAVLYPWYFWPSALVGTAVFVAVALSFASRRGASFLRWTLGLAAIVTVAAAAAEWAIAYSAGVRERDYIAGVGRFVGSAKSDGDTLFVDMAGRVPYVSGLPTEDDAGLVSRRVTAYEEAYGDGWLPRFLLARRPTWIVLRDSLESRLAGADDAPRVADVLSIYGLVRRFRYDPTALATGPFSLRLLELGTGPDFFVYRVTTPTGRPPPR